MAWLGMDKSYQNPQQNLSRIIPNMEYKISSEWSPKTYDIYYSVSILSRKTNRRNSVIKRENFSHVWKPWWKLAPVFEHYNVKLAWSQVGYAYCKPCWHFVVKVKEKKISCKTSYISKLIVVILSKARKATSINWLRSSTHLMAGSQISWGPRETFWVQTAQVLVGTQPLKDRIIASSDLKISLRSTPNLGTPSLFSFLYVVCFYFCFVFMRDEGNRNHAPILNWAEIEISLFASNRVAWKRFCTGWCRRFSILYSAIFFAEVNFGSHIRYLPLFLCHRLNCSASHNVRTSSIVVAAKLKFQCHKACLSVNDWWFDWNETAAV